MRKKLSKNAIKESFDNLPTGICFFHESGLLVLCNLQMHRLIYAMTGRDLQLYSDIAEAMAQPEQTDGNVVLLPDGTAWQFAECTVHAGESYIQVVAANVTELYGKKKQLEAGNAEYAKMVKGIKEIAGNVTAITREEEILTMKMHIHNQVGICLQKLSRYLSADRLKQDREQVVSLLRKTAGTLRQEIGNDDAQTDSLEELLQVAGSVGITIELRGEVPKEGEAEILLSHAIRECLTNVLRHAGGDHMLVTLKADETQWSAVITNNGKCPAEPITEGGGLSSLRSRMEKSGGRMDVQSLPFFALRVTVPMKKEGNWDVSSVDRR